MKYPKLRELIEATKAAVVGPYTSTFPAKPHVPHPNFRGQPRFDPQECLGCLACEYVCPAAAIAHRDVMEGPDGPYRVMIHYTDTCIFCGQCQEACINDHQGIRMTTDWELSFFDRAQSSESIEKPLQLCESCGTAVASRDHLLWLARRLGPLSYSSPTLYLSKLHALGASDEELARPSVESSRAQRFRILCARCRRQACLAEGQS